MDFTAFALSQLPPPPARVLEVGCGPAGGIVAALAAAGYDAHAIDPRAPNGRRYRSVELAEIADESYDAVVAERVFHHVHPLTGAVQQLAQMVPLVVLDEFAWDRLDAPTTEWYEAQHRVLRASGHEPTGPATIAEWRSKHRGLIPSSELLDAFRSAFEERHYETRPYLYRWLDGPASEPLEHALVRAAAIQPIGYRWVGISGA